MLPILTLLYKDTFYIPILLIIVGFILRTTYFENRYINNKLFGKAIIGVGFFLLLFITSLMAILYSKNHSDFMNVLAVIGVVAAIVFYLLQNMDDNQ